MLSPGTGSSESRQQCLDWPIGSSYMPYMEVYVYYNTYTALTQQQPQAATEIVKPHRPVLPATESDRDPASDLRASSSGFAARCTASRPPHRGRLDGQSDNRSRSCVTGKGNGFSRTESSTLARAATKNKNLTREPVLSRTRRSPFSSPPSSRFAAGDTPGSGPPMQGASTPPTNPARANRTSHLSSSRVGPSIGCPALTDSNTAATSSFSGLQLATPSPPRMTLSCKNHRVLESRHTGTGNSLEFVSLFCPVPLDFVSSFLASLHKAESATSQSPSHQQKNHTEDGFVSSQAPPTGTSTID